MTTAQEMQVVDLRRSHGWGINRIAKAVGVSDDFVEKALRKHGLHKERREMTMEERSSIAQMRKSAVSVAEISRQTGWSESKIQRVLAQASLNGWEANREVKSAAEKPLRDRIIEAYAAGASATSLAKRFGIRKSKVTAIAKEVGILREPDRLTDEQKAAILDLRAEGLGGPEIAERIGRSPAAVRDHLEKHGLNTRQVRAIRIDGDVAYVPLTRGREAIIDAADAERVGRYNWSAIKANAHHWYATGTVNGKSTLLHRFVTNAHPDLFVDHINHNGLDCRQSNLRQVNAALNAFNARRSRDTGLPKGVYRCKDGFYGTVRTPIFKTADEVVAYRAKHYGDIYGSDFIDAHKFTPDVDPDTGEAIDG